MRKSIIHALLLGLLAVVFISPAQADVVISTGAKGGTYHNVFGVNLAKVMREYGIGAQLETSKGSIENADRVGSGEAGIGFVQADAYASWFGKHPELAGETEIVGTLGKECVYIATAEGGPIDDEDDIGKGTNIAVQAQGSGSAESWAYMQQLEDDYAAANTHFTGGARALSKLKTGQLDAVLWVTSPGNLNHKFLSIVQTKGSGLRLIDVDDYDLNDKLPNGDQVYSFEKVDVEDGMFAKSITTPCTDVLVVANANADEEVLETLATILSMNTGRIVAAK